MRDSQCYTLLKYWYERQNAGQLPTFRFSFYLLGDDLEPAHDRELVAPAADNDDTPPAMDIPQGLESQGEGTSRTQRNRRKPSMGKRKTGCPVRTGKGSKGRKGKARQAVSEESVDDSEESSNSESSTDLESEKLTAPRRNSRRAVPLRVVNRISSPSSDDMYVNDIPMAPSSPGAFAPVSHTPTPAAAPVPEEPADKEEPVEKWLDSPVPGLSLELQEVSDRLAATVLERSQITLEVKEEVMVLQHGQEASDREEGLIGPPDLRKRPRDGSPQLIPSSPTKKSRSSTPYKRASTIPCLKLTPAKIDSDAVRAVPHTAKQAEKKKSISKATPGLVMSVEVSRGSRSKTAAKQTHRRSTRANPK